MTARARTTDIDPALLHSIRDGRAHAIMTGSGEAYLGAFAIQLRATEPQIALLASLPPLFGAFAQLLAVRIGDAGVRRKTLILAAATAQGLIWLPLLLLAIEGGEHAIPVLIALVVCYFICGNLGAPAWNAMMRELVPGIERGRFFSRRTRVTTVATFVALASAGLVLEQFRLLELVQWGFGGLFFTAFLARLLSVYHLARMGPALERHHVQSTHAMAAAFIPVWSRTWRSTPFVRFLIFSASLQFWAAVAAPLFALHMLRDLKFSFVEFMLVLGAAVAGQFLTLNAWGRIADAFGNRLLLRVSSCILPIVPMLWLLSDAVWALIAIQLLAGFAWGGFNLSSIGYQYELSEGQDIQRLIATYNIVIGIGVFAGALLGGWLAVLIPDLEPTFPTLLTPYPLLGVFVISALGRLLVVAVLLPGVPVPETHPRRRASLQRFILRFTRLSSVSGVIYDVVSVVRPLFGAAKVPRRSSSNRPD